MEIIHEKDINDISECNLIYDILNISKCKKTNLTIIPYYMGVWMHVEAGKNVKTWILLDIECSSTVVIIILA